MPLVQLTGIRVVVFDLDDTLYPERAFAFSGFDAVAAWLRGRAACRIDPATRMRELFDSGDRSRVFDRLLADMGVEDRERLVPEMIACYRSHEPRITLHADAEEALGRWRGRFGLGLVTDGPWEVQQRKVDALGLEARLDRVILTDRWGRDFWKPHPRAFHTIETELAASGPACVYLADNAEKDFVAPRGLGWRTVHIRREGGLYADRVPPVGGEPEFEASSFGDIELTS